MEEVLMYADHTVRHEHALYYFLPRQGLNSAASAGKKVLIFFRGVSFLKLT
ncbi:hypothetical protein GO755_00885 [Spirosoma sp. HMF4905]|uniref:Uncharacterized protein n=1 Tax=Spirosoma arboris TaxID=2682092 RepID=A0A7K1S4M5_9BACT|nr:hypothetical protein [Spirosoma arboris]MVM28566.1 hypothetical protein [Spirosoma arboris]